MKIDKRKKRIILTPKDHKTEILITGENELINLRIFYSDKGFGVEAFSDLDTGTMNEKDAQQMQVFIGDKYKAEDDYVGMWKLDPIVRKRVKKKAKNI